MDGGLYGSAWAYRALSIRAGRPRSGGVSNGSTTGPDRYLLTDEMPSIGPIRSGN